MLRLVVIGNVGYDAEIKRLDSGDQIIKTSVCHTEKWKNADGTPVEKSTWVNLSLFKKKDQSTELAKYLKKGTKIYVEGDPTVSPYLDKEGKPQASLELRVSKLELCSKKEDNDSPTGSEELPPIPDINDLPY